MKLSYYKTIAPYYDLIIPRDIKGICDSIEAIIKRYRKKKNILDLGCGTGRFSVELAKRGYHVTGLDITEEMLKVARQNAKKVKINIKYIKGDIRSFKLPKKTDVIWARGSVGDIINGDDVKRAFKNIGNNLSKEGIFIFDVRDDSDSVGKIRRSSFETRIFKKGKKKIIFRFIRDIDKRQKLVTIKGEVVIKSTKYFEKYKVKHTMKYYAKKEIMKLLAKVKFKILEIFPGYESEKIKLPRLVAVVQK